MTGLRAGEAERQAAAKEDTPYGRHRRAAMTYETAKLKCQQGQQTFPTRMAADEKLADQYGVLVNKMVDAQGRGDNRAYLAYNDSAMAMQDPNCVIKEPKQPDDFYETERAIETRAEKASIKASGFTRS
ncbi:MAG: hypothetical protein H0T86_12515, partial [Gemmatimonadales bacterium]|nr:hypothetical protein [Gemmatimonadales bacterium]